MADLVLMMGPLDPKEARTIHHVPSVSTRGDTAQSTTSKRQAGDLIAVGFATREDFHKAIASRIANKVYCRKSSEHCLLFYTVMELTPTTHSLNDIDVLKDAQVAKTGNFTRVAAK